MDYSWVDSGLEKLGLKLDLTVNELPHCFRTQPNQPLTVKHLMENGPKVFTAPVLHALSKKQPDVERNSVGSWAVDIGTYDGNSVVSDRTILRDLPGLSKKDFVKLVVDDAMVDIAKSWDATFVEAEFTHIITREGKTFAKGEKESLSGVPVQDVAKIMRWVFLAAGLTKREVISVYVTSVDDKSIATWYFPVKGDLFRVPSPGCVRGRLMVPCVDRGVFGPDGSIVTFEHYASASLGGWVPNWVISVFGKGKFLEGSIEEGKHFLRTFEEARDPNSSFSKTPCKDRTMII